MRRLIVLCWIVKDTFNLSEARDKQPSLIAVQEKIIHKAAVTRDPVKTVQAKDSEEHQRITAKNQQGSAALYHLKILGKLTLPIVTIAITLVNASKNPDDLVKATTVPDAAQTGAPLPRIVMSAP